MFSTSIPLSTPFLGPKFVISAPSHPPTCVRFRLACHDSAAYPTAERTTSHITTNASLYEVLGIQMGATSQEIKTAYRRLARVVHPDVASNDKENTSADDFIRTHAAYATLSDPQKRADYDRTLFWRPRRPVSSGFSGCMLRKWETDQCW